MKKVKTNTLIDVAIRENRNVTQKEAEKRIKYESLCVEVQRMWKMRCRIIPIVTRATGAVINSLNNNSEATPEKHSIDSLQKTAVLGTAHTIRKMLQSEPGRWGSALVQERYRGEKACDEGQRNNNNNNNNNNIIWIYSTRNMLNP